MGVLSGMLGIGGGTVMVPLFRLGFGMGALQATGTSLFTMVFTSAAGSLTHVRNRTCLVPLGLIAGLCGAFMSPVGVHLANISPAWLVMLATALVIAYSATTMLRKGLAMPRSAAARAVRPDDGAEPILPELSRAQYAIGALAGIVAGLAGGYVGLGGGFLMVPIFLSGVGLSMKQASGTSLLAVSILALAGSLAQAAHGNLEVLAGLAMAMGSIPGAMLGASLIKRIPERALRLMFGGFLLVVAAVLAANEFLA